MSDFSDLLTKLPVKICQPGELLIEEEYGNRPLYFLKQGRVLISRGGISICEVSESGAIFGELSFLLGIPATATVRVLDLSEVYHVENADDFLKEHPETLLEVSRQLARRLIAIDHHFIESKNAFDELQSQFETSGSTPPPATTAHPIFGLWRKTHDGLIRHWHGAKD